MPRRHGGSLAAASLGEEGDAQPLGLRKDITLWIAVAGAVFLSASGFTGTEVGLEGYSPGSLALLRFLVASFALAIYAVLWRMRLPKARDLPALALAGFLAFSAFTVLLAYGQLTVPAGTASLLIATIPAFTALWAVAFLRPTRASLIPSPGFRRRGRLPWSLSSRQRRSSSPISG